MGEVILAVVPGVGDRVRQGKAPRVVVRTARSRRTACPVPMTRSCRRMPLMPARLAAAGEGGQRDDHDRPIRPGQQVRQLRPAILRQIDAPVPAMPLPVHGCVVRPGVARFGVARRFRVPCRSRAVCGDLRLNGWASTRGSVGVPAAPVSQPTRCTCLSPNTPRSHRSSGRSSLRPSHSSTLSGSIGGGSREGSGGLASTWLVSR